MHFACFLHKFGKIVVEAEYMNKYIPEKKLVVVQVPGRCGVRVPRQLCPESVPHAAEVPDTLHPLSDDLLLHVRKGEREEEEKVHRCTHIIYAQIARTTSVKSTHRIFHSKFLIPVFTKQKSIPFWQTRHIFNTSHTKILLA